METGQEGTIWDGTTAGFARGDTFLDTFRRTLPRHGVARCIMTMVLSVWDQFFLIFVFCVLKGISS